MIRRAVGELQFVKSTDPSPTIEIHSDSLQARGLNLRDIATEALACLAAADPTIRATVYIFGTISINFHEPAWSEFLVVPKTEKVLHALHSAFSIPGVKMRYGDYVCPSDGLRVFHLQDGHVWQPEDELTWFSSSTWSGESAPSAAIFAASDDEHGTDDDFEEISLDGIDPDELYNADGEDESDDELITVARKAEQPSRYRSARSDAKVATIRQAIEAAFGLPAGSVALCGPDGRALRGDALIKTLRRRWEEP